VLCWIPSAAELAVGVGADPFVQLKRNGDSAANAPRPRSGISGDFSMSVRALIAFPPARRTSGASDVLVPPLANPQTAQSSVPGAVRLNWTGGVAELAAV